MIIMANWTEILRYLWNFTIFFITNIYCLFVYVMWSLMLFPLRFLSPSLCWDLESLLFKGLQSFVILWMGTGRYRVIESGDDVSRLSEQEVLLMCNHQSTADSGLVMMSLWGKGRCMNRPTWIMDWLFQFTNFGLVGILRKDIFIKQGRETRDQQGEMLKDHLLHSYLPLQRRWIILFPEGGFLYKRLESSQSYARKHGYPVLQNVTLPRLGALKTIIDSVGSQDRDTPSTNTPNGCANSSAHDRDRPLKWVVDMTMGYRNNEGGPPDMFGMCVGYREEQDVHVHYRAYPVSGIPRGEKQLQKWMFDRYAEKDQLLDELCQTGHFPTDSDDVRVLPTIPERQVTYDWLKIVLFQLFYLLSAYVQYSYIVRPLMLLFW